ncbi:hypothetical protein [Streptomyces sp. NPDC127038]|uniref:hypothetical protein n=1 Tax=Streptomyces sp. NPDC127038 TaxID=3347114 RepID=UPI00365ECB04
MNQRAGLAHHDHDQGLALTLAVLLLTGGVLLAGPLTTFAAVAVLSSSLMPHPASPAAWPVRRALRRLLWVVWFVVEETLRPRHGCRGRRLGCGSRRSAVDGYQVRSLR